MAFVAPEAAVDFAQALENMPPQHRIRPQILQEVSSLDEAKAYFEAFAFTEGHVMVVTSGSGRKPYLRMDCYRHGEETRNTRKLVEEDRTRPNTSTYQNGCPYFLYCSYRKVPGDTRKAFLIADIKAEHNHAPNPDPFHHPKQMARKPQCAETLRIGAMVRGAGQSFSSATRILGQDEMYIPQKKYYSLIRSGASLTREQQAEVLCTSLQSAGFRVAIRESYHLNPLTGERESRVVQQIFFCSSLQITLARRFINDWILQTDATFNTNVLRLPLSVITGATNTGHTFPVGLSFILSESAETFSFIDQQMDLLMWYDCNGPQVVLGDQAKGLISSIKNGRDQRKAEGKRAIILQLCAYHVASNMQTRFRKAGKYDEDKMKELTGQIWTYIQAPTMEELDTARENLLQNLQPAERTYLEKNWLEKEEQFCKVWTGTYPNLGAHTTQRVEGYHNVIKSCLNRQLSLPEACLRLSKQIQQLGRTVLQHESNDRHKTFRLLDREAFRLMVGKVTHFALHKLSVEWESTKEWARRLGEGRVDWEEEEEGPQPGPEPLDIPGCQSACELPVRFDLPCMHWMHACIELEIPIPLSLLHPRWLIDGPELTQDWRMSFQLAETDNGDEAPFPAAAAFDRGRGDRMRGDGRDLVMQSALQGINIHDEQLTGNNKIKFAIALEKSNKNLISEFTANEERKENLPVQLPEALPTRKESLREFHAHGNTRKRAMTSLEIVQDDQKKAKLAERKKKKKEEKGSAPSNPGNEFTRR